MTSVRAIAIAALVLAAAVAAQSIPTRGWSSLFQPPFENCPTIMMAISCPEEGACFVPAGASGSGFGVFRFDGQFNGNFVPVTTPDSPIMIMAIAVGGTSANPKGAAGGIGFGNGVEYFVNSTTMMPSQQPFMVVTQDMRATKDGQHILVIDQGNTSANIALVSHNAGKNFTAFVVDTLVPTNDTWPRYGAYPSEKVMYMTLGGWPAQAPPSADEIAVSARVSMVRDPKTGAWKRKAKRMSDMLGAHLGEAGYSCVVAKSVDGGATWHNLMIESRTYYPNGIDCVSDTHCLWVGEGFDDKAGAHVWLTTDGVSYKETLHLVSNASGQFSLMSVKFNGPSEAWVAGSFQAQTASGTQGIFYYTKDGGETWEKHDPITFVGDVTDMSFTPSGVGYATAITVFDDSTVLRYSPTGPPQTPAPTWLGNFTQTECTDANCQVGCTTGSFQQLACLPMSGGGSGIGQCADGVLNMWIYPFATNCTGLYEMEAMALDVCQQSESGGSFETFCGPALNSAAQLVDHKRARHN